MKKVLLFSVLFIVTTLVAIAYETIIIDFPDGEKWDAAYYKKIGYEAILQYTPYGETSNDWVRSIVIHSYGESDYPVRVFSSNALTKMKKVNPTANYKTLRMNLSEALFTRCTDDYKDVKGQCEFYRVTRAHDKTITIHYMNKNKEDFKDNYTVWLEIIRSARFLNTYYRNDRTLNKSEYFEL